MEDFVIKWLLNIPPKLSCVATLPREMPIDSIYVFNTVYTVFYLVL